MSSPRLDPHRALRFFLRHDEHDVRMRVKACASATAAAMNAGAGGAAAAAAGSSSAAASKKTQTKTKTRRKRRVLNSRDRAGALRRLGREASALREQLLAETSGVLQAGFLGSDLLYYKAHLIFSVVDTLARHPAVVSAVQRALGSEDVLLWDASIPLKPPTSSDAGADENASTFFPWHQVILLRNHLSRSVENGGIDSHAGGADLAVQ